MIRSGTTSPQVAAFDEALAGPADTNLAQSKSGDIGTNSKDNSTHSPSEGNTKTKQADDSGAE